MIKMKQLPSIYDSFIETLEQTSWDEANNTYVKYEGFATSVV